MKDGYIKVEQSFGLKNEIELIGAKNAVLVIMASLLLTSGKSVIKNVPCSADVLEMIGLLRHLGAEVFFDRDRNYLEVDTSLVSGWTVTPSIMQKTRASFLVMGPLLARFGKVTIALPGGCAIGARPIDYHLKNFAKMGVNISFENGFLCATADALVGTRLILEYPSVGATENILMAATRARGATKIIHAALEPEVLDLIVCLQKMGADITIASPASIIVRGVAELHPIEHEIIFDRLEAGSLLLATAAMGGEIYLPQLLEEHLDLFLLKLVEMGHSVTVGPEGKGIFFKATTSSPRAVSFKTGPFPGFPTDLQAPMMALQCFALGSSIIEETVFENRFLHVHELKKMGACISIEHNKATITGVQQLYGTQVVATDIRASMALVVAGLAAQGSTIITKTHHWKRGFDALEKKLIQLGAKIMLHEAHNSPIIMPAIDSLEKQEVV